MKTVKKPTTLQADTIKNILNGKNVEVISNNSLNDQHVHYIINSSNAVLHYTA